MKLKQTTMRFRIQTQVKVFNLTISALLAEFDLTISIARYSVYNMSCRLMIMKRGQITSGFISPISRPHVNDPPLEYEPY